MFGSRLKSISRPDFGILTSGDSLGHLRRPLNFRMSGRILSVSSHDYSTLQKDLTYIFSFDYTSYFQFQDDPFTSNRSQTPNKISHRHLKTTV